MAKISTYQQDDIVQGNDNLIGSSSDGTTKTYTLDSIANYFTVNNVVAVDGQQNMRFVTRSQDVADGTFFLNNFVGADSNLTDIQTVYLSKYSTQGENIETLLREMFEDKLKMSSTTKPNDYAVFQVDNIQTYVQNPRFLEISISNGVGKGTLSQDVSYAFTTPVVVSKTYVHIQDELSNTWPVEHNLNKYPSVTIVDSGDTILYTEVEYIDKDNLIIRFVASTSGKAFLN